MRKKNKSVGDNICKKASKLQDANAQILQNLITIVINHQPLTTVLTALYIVSSLNNPKSLLKTLFQPLPLPLLHPKKKKKDSGKLCSDSESASSSCTDINKSCNFSEISFLYLSYQNNTRFHWECVTLTGQTQCQTHPQPHSAQGARNNFFTLGSLCQRSMPDMKSTQIVWSNIHGHRKTHR